MKKLWMYFLVLGFVSSAHASSKLLTTQCLVKGESDDYRLEIQHSPRNVKAKVFYGNFYIVNSMLDQTLDGEWLDVRIKGYQESPVGHTLVASFSLEGAVTGKVTSVIGEDHRTGRQSFGSVKAVLKNGKAITVSFRECTTMVRQF